MSLETGLQWLVTMSDSLYDLILSAYRFTPTGVHPVRQAQVKQFLNPDQQVLPESPDRPQALSKFQDRAFKSLREFVPNQIMMPESLVGQPAPDQPTKLPHRRLNPYNAGMGNSTLSLGKDDKGHYLSIFDSWDFDEPYSSGSLIPGFEDWLRNKGTPFNIYDRYHFSGSTIPPWIEKNARTTDIELPAIEGLRRAQR